MWLISHKSRSFGKMDNSYYFQLVTNEMQNPNRTNFIFLCHTL